MVLRGSRTTGLTQAEFGRSVLGAFYYQFHAVLFESTGPRIISSFSQEMG